MDEFKTAVSGCFRRIFPNINAKIAFILECPNHRKQSCFIIAFSFLCPLKRKKSGEWEDSKPQPGAFAKFSIYSFLFFPLDSLFI